jgi:hypothetical protein
MSIVAVVVVVVVVWLTREALMVREGRRGAAVRESRSAGAEAVESAEEDAVEAAERVRSGGAGCGWTSGWRRMRRREAEEMDEEEEEAEDTEDGRRWCGCGGGCGARGGEDGVTWSDVGGGCGVRVSSARAACDSGGRGRCSMGGVHTGEFETTLRERHRDAETQRHRERSVHWHVRTWTHTHTHDAGLCGRRADYLASSGRSWNVGFRHGRTNERMTSLICVWRTPRSSRPGTPGVGVCESSSCVHA